MEEGTTTPRLEGQKGKRCHPEPMLTALLSQLERLLPPRESPPLPPCRKLGAPILLQSGSLKSRGAVAGTARARVHECHAAEVAVVPAAAAASGRALPEQQPRTCTHPPFLLLPLLEKGETGFPSAFQSPTSASQGQNLMESQWTKKSKKGFQPLAIQRRAHWDENRVVSKPLSDGTCKFRVLKVVVSAIFLQCLLREAQLQN